MFRLTSKLLFAALLGAFLLPRLAAAQADPPPPPPPYNEFLTIQYYDVSINDNIVRLINPTMSDNFEYDPPPPPGMAQGLLCAMVYVFDANQELQECCGCPVTNNGLRKLSVKTDLISNPLGGPTPPSGLVVVVSAQPNVAQRSNGSFPPFYPCDPGPNQPYFGAPNLAGWITHIDQNHSYQNLSEDEFRKTPSDTDVYDDPVEGLVSLCSFIHLNGTGHGVCTCGVGDNQAAATATVAP